MKTLLQAGLIHGDCLTVTGKTVEENLKDVKGVSEIEKQDVLFDVKNPLSPPLTHITIIKGNLAPKTAVLKLGGGFKTTLFGLLQFFFLFFAFFFLLSFFTRYTIFCRLFLCPKKKKNHLLLLLLLLFLFLDFGIVSNNGNSLKGP